MNYIVIDLEWTQSPVNRKIKNKDIPFEIIEIGAIKLDETRHIIDEFSELIKPTIFKDLHYRTKELIHLELKDFEGARSFSKVVKKFFQWCGKDYIFCTWGNMDLTELQRNLVYYNIKGIIDKPITYYDVQILFSLAYMGIDKNTQKTLEYAIDFLHLDKTEVFHRALYDAKYTAVIFAHIPLELVLKNSTIDFYHNPKEKGEEIHLIYEKTSKDVFREYETREELLQKRDIRSTKCFQCKKIANKKLRWFTNNLKTYYCLAYCKQHGYIKGKLTIKKTFGQQYYAVKDLFFITEKEACELIEKNQQLKKKKKQKARKKRVYEKHRI